MSLLKYILSFVMFFMANGSICAELKTVDLYSENFLMPGKFAYNEGNALFIKNCTIFNFVTEDTVLLEYSSDFKTLDSVYVHYPFRSDGITKTTIDGDHYLFHSHYGIIAINRHDKRDVKLYKFGKIFYAFITGNNYLYPVNSIPGSMNPWNIQFQRLSLPDRENWKNDTTVVQLPPVKGFELMYVQPRMEVAFFNDYLVVADPCIENLYYYDFAGKLLKSVRIDSLLNIEGNCAQFEKFKGDRKSPKRDFDKLLDINEEGKILRSINNYKGRLLLQLATGYHENDIYIIDPETLKWQKPKLKADSGKFTVNEIPIDNFSTIEGDHIITEIPSDIKGLDFSRFKSYEDFKNYTEENRNTGTSYLVRELIFD